MVAPLTRKHTIEQTSFALTPDGFTYADKQYRDADVLAIKSPDERTNGGASSNVAVGVRSIVGISAWTPSRAKGPGSSAMRGVSKASNQQRCGGFTTISEPGLNPGGAL